MCTYIPYYVVAVQYTMLYTCSSIPSLKPEMPSPDSHLDDSVVLLKERLGSAYLVTKTILATRILHASDDLLRSIITVE